MSKTKAPAKAQTQDSPESEMDILLSQILEAGTKSLDAYDDYCDGKIAYGEARQAIINEQLDLESIKLKLMQMAAKSGELGALYLMLYFDLKDNSKKAFDTIKDLARKAAENDDLKV